jgi:hypothetical protein
MVPEPYTSEDVENAILESDWVKLKEIWVSDPSVGVDAAGVIENRLNKQLQEPKEKWDIPEAQVKDLIIDGLDHPSCFWAGRNVVFAKKYRVDIISKKLDELKLRSSSDEEDAHELRHAIDVYEGNMPD